MRLVGGIPINAVKIDPVSQVRLKNYFFESVNPKALESELANAIIEESLLLEQSKTELLAEKGNHLVNEITSAQVKNIKKDIEENPPLRPDYQRIVEIYTNKFQYVRLKFEGANLQHQRVNIPRKALPINDQEIRRKLDAKLNLFDEEMRSQIFQPLYLFNERVKEFRSTYLFKIKNREESLLKLTDKARFKEEINILESELENLRHNIFINLHKQIKYVKETLRGELRLFLSKNIDLVIPDLAKNKSYFGNELYLEDKMDSEIDKILNSIKWPDAHSLVEKFAFSKRFSDITYEDLKDENFLNELAQAGIIGEADVAQLSVIRDGLELK